MHSEKNNEGSFNAGSGAMDSEHFVNAKAEAYWCLRESLERVVNTVPVENIARGTDLLQFAAGVS